jgi:outer membrane protein assembly factor BamB
LSGAVRCIVGATGPHGGGIWGYGGLSFDPSIGSLFAATGNALTDPENFPNSEAVVELDSNLNLQSANSPVGSNKNGDTDFGSTPVVYQPPNCPVELAAMNKNGILYIYNRDAINNGPMQELQIATGASAGQFVGLVAYDPVFNQVYVRSTSDDGIGFFFHGIIALAVQADCTLGLVWQQQIGINNGGDVNNAATPPIAANGVVYAATGTDSKVYAFDAASGEYLWDTGSLIQNGVYASPMVVNGQLFVAGFDHNLYAFGLPQSATSSSSRRSGKMR